MTQILADLGLNSSGASIDDDPLGVQGAKICPRRDIARLQLQAQAERLDHAASHLKLDWIVAEQCEMAGAASRRNPGGDGNHPALRCIFGQGVQVWSRCSFK